MKKKITLLIAVMLTNVSIPSFAQAPNWLWAKAMGDTLYDHGNSIAVDATGNVYTIGSFHGTFYLTASSLAYYDIFISKLDASGNFIWAKAIDGTNDLYAPSLYLDASGNVYSTGSFQYTVDFDLGPGTFYLTSAGDYDVFILKMDSSGNFVWAKSMGGSNRDVGGTIAVDASGNIYTAGQFFQTADFDPG